MGGTNKRNADPAMDITRNEGIDTITSEAGRR